MELEEVDADYWRDIDTLTVWQAAFIVCNAEPWDEPISANAKPPKQIEKMRSVLLENIPNFETGDIFAQSGWSCKPQRPAQLSGLYFSSVALRQWAAKFYINGPLPLVFQ
jgi:hypothetical protein